MKRFAMMAALVALGAPALAQQVQVDPALPAYQKTSGVSGNINSVGSDTMNNMMTLWAEAFLKMYPNVKVQVEGKGSSTAPPALIAGHLAVRSDVARDARHRGRPVRGQVRLQADPAAHLLRRPRRLRQQGQPAREAHPRPGGRGLLEDAPPRVQAERHDLGPARAHRRLGEPPDQPLRPQLGLRHLRLLQGAQPQQRRLQGQREGAAGFRLGRPGRDRGPLRHGLLGHRLQDLGREGGGARRTRTATPSPPAATRT